MSACPNCSAPMIPLFTGLACSAECDLLPAPPPSDWETLRRKLPPRFLGPFVRGLAGSAWYIWQEVDGWHVSAHMTSRMRYGAFVIVRVGPDGMIVVQKNRFGPCALGMLPDHRERPGRCPSCDSPSPHLHPAVQFEGEVRVCRHDFHRTVTPENTPARIREWLGVEPL